MLLEVRIIKILVVDDEPDVLLLCRVNLEFEGYEVIDAGDGYEALRRIREVRPDLVLLDVMMPEMDGWKVLSVLKSDEETRDIPVVMLTAKVRDLDQIQGLMGGAADYISKPFNPIALSRTIKEILDETRTGERRQRMLQKLMLTKDL